MGRHFENSDSHLQKRKGDPFLGQAVIMECVSIVSRRNLSEIVRDDLEIVQVVRDYGSHAGILRLSLCLLSTVFVCF